MRLKRLQIRRLYGSLNKDVSFHPELNLLVGINGSGKTSVLNAVDWLLRADTTRLATTPFERLTLELEESGDNLIIEAVQTNETLDIFVERNGQRPPPYNIKLKVPPTQIRTQEEATSLGEAYKLLQTEEHEVPTWSALTQLRKPTSITLDRTISAESEEETFIDERRYPKQRKPRRDSALAQVIKLTTAKYVEYRTEVERLNEELKTQMVLSALRDPGNPFQMRSSAPSISAAEVEKLERKVIDYVSTSLKGTDVAERTRQYFRRVRTIITTRTNYKSKRPNDELLFWMISGRFQQLEEIAGAFNAFERKSAKAFESLKKYFEVINRFFSESKKELVINETNHLGFRFINTDGTAEDRTRNVRHLSSGERQILILFTFLAFHAQGSSVFILDEPELSLHPKWQSEFLGAFLSLKPEGTQLLLATHSPDIVGRHKESCIVLLP